MLFPLGWLAHRSLRLLHGLGGALGWLGYAASPTYRRRLNENAELAGVGLPDRKAAVADAGRLVMELPRLWLRPRDQPINDPVRWEGAELLEAMLARGQGLVLLTPHMGSFEVSAQAYAERFGAKQPITVLYRPARQTWLRELEETARARPALSTAPANLAGVRLLMRALKRGETVGLLPDQVPPEGMGVWVPFFGKPAYTMTLAARLIQQTGAAVAVLWTERAAAGAGYVVRAMALPVSLPEQSGGDEASALAINQSMEAVIRMKPSQYLWGYNRYKNPRQLPTAPNAPNVSKVSNLSNEEPKSPPNKPKASGAETTS
jgi:Kdo2-lipid IVA lauroyltransferase/acyltransferase